MAPGLVFLLAASVFVRSAAPGVTFEDSGELAAAASVLGVPHPPGYPLFTLAGHLWLRLSEPWIADAARALALFSALCAAGAAALVAHTIARAGGSFAAAGATAGLLVLAPTFAGQAVVCEVYAPAALVQALLVATCLTRPERVGRAWLLFGLAVAAHQASLALLPLPLLAHLRARREAPGAVPWRRVAWTLPGLSLYLYVPLAARRDPPVNWGDIDSLPTLLDHLLRRQYQTGLPRDWEGQGAFLAEQLAGQWPLASVAVVLGLLWARRQLPGAAVRPLLATVLTLAALLFYAINFPMVDASRARLAGSFTPLVLATTTLAGLVIVGLERRFAGVPSSLPALLFVALAVPVQARTLSGSTHLADASWADDYARELLAEAPAEALLVIGRVGYGDVLYFPVWYRQLVYQERPDVLLLQREFLEIGWYRRQLARRQPELRPLLAALEDAFHQRPDLASERLGRRTLVNAFLAALFELDRPLVYVVRPGEALLAGRSVTPGVALWHAHAGAWEGPLATEPGGTWLPPEDRDPWTAELRRLVHTRDRARAELLRQRGEGAAARRLEGRGGVAD